MPPTSAELISAVRHPLRRQILNAYVEGAVECASAKDLAQALDRQVGQVAYHLKTLARGEILRPVPSGDGEEDGISSGWALGVEPEWLRLLLEVWADADAPADFNPS